jgi:hypothetical protein
VIQGAGAGSAVTARGVLEISWDYLIKARAPNPRELKEVKLNKSALIFAFCESKSVLSAFK